MRRSGGAELRAGSKGGPVNCKWKVGGVLDTARLELEVKKQMMSPRDGEDHAPATVIVENALVHPSIWTGGRL